MAGLLSVFAEFERDIMRERVRVRAGLAHARLQGKRLGRPPTAAGKAGTVRDLFLAGISKSEITRRLKIGRISVRRLLEEKKSRSELAYAGLPKGHRSSNSGLRCFNSRATRTRAVNASIGSKPFLADFQSESQSEATIDAVGAAATAVEIDTVVVPAREDGFKEVFLGENRWYAVRIHGSMRPQIKYVAAYQVAPVSAITHVAPVRSIEPWKDTGKVVLNFAEPAKEIRAIPMPGKGRVRSFQNLRYTSLERIQSAQSLDDIWGIP
jgi:hypothetical protein